MRPGTMTATRGVRGEAPATGLWTLIGSARGQLLHRRRRCRANHRAHRPRHRRRQAQTTVPSSPNFSQRRTATGRSRWSTPRAVPPPAPRPPVQSSPKRQNTRSLVVEVRYSGTLEAADNPKTSISATSPETQKTFFPTNRPSLSSRRVRPGHAPVPNGLYLTTTLPQRTTRPARVPG